MSLAEKFDKISEAEVPAIVAAVKSDGLQKSGLADNWEVLQARVGSKDEKEAVAAAKAIIALMDEAPTSQVFVKECLGACKFFVNFGRERNEKVTNSLHGFLCYRPRASYCQEQGNHHSHRRGRICHL